MDSEIQHLRRKSKKIIQAQLYNYKNVVEQLDVMHNMYSVENKENANELIITYMEEYEEKNNEVILSQDVHNLFYNCLLEKGRYDTFFICVTQQIQALGDFPFVNSLKNLILQGYPKYQKFLTGQIEKSQNCPTDEGVLYSMSATLT
eukprot:UN28421